MILLELALNGSGAATFESFYGYNMRGRAKETKKKQKYRFTFVTDHDDDDLSGGGTFDLVCSCPIHHRQTLIVDASLPHPTPLYIQNLIC